MPRSSPRSRREAELGQLQRCVEEETRRHEAQLSELRVRHSGAIDNLQEQLDNSKRVRERRGEGRGERGRGEGERGGEERERGGEERVG